MEIVKKFIDTRFWLCYDESCLFKSECSERAMPAILTYRKLRKSISPFVLFGYKKISIGEQLPAGVTRYFRLYGGFPRILSRFF